MSTIPSNRALGPPTYTGLPGTPQPARPWSGGRVIALVLGSIIGLASLGALVTGLVALAFDQTQREADGFIETGPVIIESNGYAVTVEGLQVDIDVPGWLQLRSLVGDIRLTVESLDGQPVFLGVAREGAAAAYLTDLAHDEVSRISDGTVTYVPHTGTEPVGQPAEQQFWSAWTSGPGEQTLTVELESGTWVAVVMKTDGSPGVEVVGRAAAELPALPTAGIVLLVAGTAGLIISGLVIYLAVRTGTR